MTPGRAQRWTNERLRVQAARRLSATLSPETLDQASRHHVPSIYQDEENQLER